MKTPRWVLVAVLAFSGCTTPPRIVKRSPPQDRLEQPDFKPGPDFFWKRGHWAYDPSQDQYVWIAGSWDRERVNRTWIPGFWEPKGDGWVWREEQWEEKAR